MTFIPFVPFIPPGKPKPAGPPPWLQLEPGEVFVRMYGEESKKPVKAIIALALGLLVFAQLGFLFYAKAQKGVGVESDGIPVVITALIVLFVVGIGIALAVKKSALIRGAANQTVLTSKMLVIKAGNDIAGVRLGDIVRVTESSGKAKAFMDVYIMDVYIKGQATPVVVLPVADIAAGIAELTAYATAEGAELS